MNSKPIRSLLLAVTVLTLVVGSSLAAWTHDAAHADHPDLMPSRTTQDGDDELVAGNNAFAFDLYQAIREEGDNLIFSPYSISLALAMVYAGARGDTEQQMADVLHFTLPQDELHPAFGLLDQSLPREVVVEWEGDEYNFQLNIANAVWAQEDYPILPDYLTLLEANYRAGLQLVDFANAPEDSRLAINDWVSDETEERIPDLLAPGSITPLTRLVLTNAIYFKAAWNQFFNSSLTSDGTFYPLDGDPVTVPMMFQSDQFSYMAGEGYQAVWLSYRGYRMGMLILLPDAGQFATFESQLDADRFNATLSALEQMNIHLTMPRFEYESDFSLAGVLAAMGMPVAFSGEADFSGMTGTHELFISDVIHKAFINVNEQGTEAAAATAIMMGGGGPPNEPFDVIIDRPFIYAITDRQTGAILFLGRVVNPAE